MVLTESVPQISRNATGLGAPRKVACLTAGGLAPCLSSSVGGLITEYAVKHPQTEIICYTNGYKGLLLGESIHVTPGIRATAGALRRVRVRGLQLRSQRFARDGGRRRGRG